MCYCLTLDSLLGDEPLVAGIGLTVDRLDRLDWVRMTDADFNLAQVLDALDVFWKSVAVLGD